MRWSAGRAGIDARLLPTNKSKPDGGRSGRPACSRIETGGVDLGAPGCLRRIHRPRDNAGDLTSTTVEWTWFRSVTPTKIQGLFQDPERFLRWPHNKKRNVTVWSLSVCKAPTQAKLFTFIGNRSLFQCVPGPHHFSGLTMIFWVWAPWMDTEKTKSSQRRYVSAVISTTCQ